MGEPSGVLGYIPRQVRRTLRLASLGISPTIRRATIGR